MASDRCDAIPEPRFPAIDAALEKRGYPLRHRRNLAHMHGPSFDKAMAMRDRVMRGDCLLLLVGDRGPGKTQMATWWAAERLREGKSAGHYRKTTDLLAEIKQTWGDGGKSYGTETDVLRKYQTCGFLVLDEFHERGDSDWASRTLVNIIDHRYDAMLATILIANLSSEQIHEHINPSILSRAEETGGRIDCTWESYRRAAA